MPYVRSTHFPYHKDMIIVHPSFMHDKLPYTNTKSKGLENEISTFGSFLKKKTKYLLPSIGGQVGPNDCMPSIGETAWSWE